MCVFFVISKYLANYAMKFVADGGWSEDFQFLTMPEELLIEIIARNKIHFEVSPLVGSLYLALRFMDG